MNSIGALVLTKNEETNIEECLKTLIWTDDLIVIDSYSTDQTVDLCKKYTRSVYQRAFDNFSAQRNFGLKQLKTEWVLIIDADERVPKDLEQEIRLIIKNSAYDFYKISRRNYFLGKWIKYCGWYPDYSLRLFKRKGVIYKGKVHESIVSNGRIGKLKNSIIHYTYHNLNHYLDKINHYTTLSAEEKFHAGKKVNLLYIVLRSTIEFVKKYLFQKGFLLGVPGFILSVISAYYQFLKYIKLWEKHHINPEE